MYRLIVKEDNGVWHPIDLGDESPAMMYEVNDIAELKNRNADGSQSIRLPKTNNNLAAFGFLSAPDSASRAPYKRHECRLLSNDYILAGRGSYLVFDRIGQFLEVQILSGNANFFDYLNDNKLESLDLGYAELSLDGIKEDSERYIFPAATFRTDSINAAGSLKEIEPERIFPSVYLKYIIETMVSTHGFSLVHNIKDEDFDNKLISLATLKPDESSLDIFKAYSNTTAIVETNRGSQYLRWSLFDADTAGGLLTTYNPTGGESSIQYESPIDGIVNVTVEYEDMFPFKGWLRKFGSDGEGQPWGSWQRPDGGPIASGSGTERFQIEVQKGDKVRLSFLYVDEAGGSGVPPTRTMRYKFSVDGFKTDVVPFGGKIPLSKNLGFDSQLDLFKAFAQLFGLVISVDNVGRVVYAYTFDKLYDNKSIAKDWSDKLDIDPNIETVFDLTTYAQVNAIVFDTDNKYTDTGIFIIDNQSLAPSKELFKIEFQSGRDYYQILKIDDVEIGFIVANIPLLEYVVDRDEETGEKTTTVTFKDGKPHILNRAAEKKIFIVKSDDGVEETIDLYPVTHATAQSFIDIHYNRLVNNMLKDAKKVEPFFNLNEYDIEMFDQMVPVYINYYGAYFYVNKINNFISDRLTRCELIQL